MPVASNMQEHVMEVCATNMYTLSTMMLCTEPTWNITCKKLASQLYHSKKVSNRNKSVIIPANGILKQQYVLGLKHDITIVPHSVIPTTLHEFHDSKGYQGTICTFEAIRRSYWWPNLWQDIVKYIGKCSVCAEDLPSMVR